MTDLKKRLGQRVVELRLQGKMTQAQLADDAGISPDAIGRLERSQTIPPLERLEAIASALGVPLSVLLEFRKQSSARDRAMQRLTSVLAGKSEKDVLLVAEVAALMLKRDDDGS